MASNRKRLGKKVKEDIDKLGEKGYRCIGVAHGGKKGMYLSSKVLPPPLSLSSPFPLSPSSIPPPSPPSSRFSSPSLF
jgi:hypothetical protein